MATQHPIDTTPRPDLDAALISVTGELFDSAHLARSAVAMLEAANGSDEDDTLQAVMSVARTIDRNAYGSATALMGVKMGDASETKGAFGRGKDSLYDVAALADGAIVMLHGVEQYGDRNDLVAVSRVLRTMRDLAWDRAGEPMGADHA